MKPLVIKRNNPTPHYEIHHATIDHSDDYVEFITLEGKKIKEDSRIEERIPWFDIDKLRQQASSRNWKL